MSKKKNKSPEMFVEGTIPAAAIVAGSKLVYDVTRDVFVARNAKKPLFIAVYGTRTKDDKHELIVVIQNQGSHGVYLEGIETKDPQGIRAVTYYNPRNSDETELTLNKVIGFGYSTLEYGKPILPAHLLPSSTKCFQIVLDKFTTNRLEKKPYGTLNLKYTVAGLTKANLSVDIPFSVRLEQENT